jgi:hypothetical protein
MANKIFRIHTVVWCKTLLNQSLVIVFILKVKNIRILATDSQTSGSITNEKGTTFITAIPKPVINATLKTITYGTKTLFRQHWVSYHASADPQIIGTCNSKIMLLYLVQIIKVTLKVHYVSGDITLLYLEI